jgi:hypothetical protein
VPPPGPIVHKPSETEFGTVTEAPRPTPTYTVAALLAAVGAAPGIALSVTPFVLMSAYVDAFVATATPDSGFNVSTIPAVLCVYLAALLAVMALAMMVARKTRPLGWGYLGGLACGAAVDLLINLTTGAT